MTATDWLLYGLAALAALAATFIIYHVRETAVRRRLLLVLLRAGVLAVLLLLLWDPDLPVGEVAREGGSWVLLDGTLSMNASAEGTTVWGEAVRSARVQAAGSARLYVFGAGLRALPPESLAVVQPDALASRIVPWLSAAAESGARSIVVISDMRFSDGAELGPALAELRPEVRFRPASLPVRNAAVRGIAAPRTAVADTAFAVSVELRTEGFDRGDAETVSVELWEGGRLVGATRVVAGEPGALVRATFRVRPPREGGLVRYDAVVRAAGDGFPDDDTRSVYVSVAPDEGGVALVSFRPDWEPRFLLPVLEMATGLRTRGYLRVGSTYVTMGGAPEEIGRRATESEVREAAGRADIVVLHGAGAGTPPWAVEAARSALRVLLFPVDAPGARALGVNARPAPAGEWYVTAELPPSPFAAALAGMPAEVLPPLTDPITVTDAGEVAVALRAQWARRGAAEPVLLLETAGSRRRVLAAARGFWRWSFRPGPARETYRKLWAAAAGWLLEGEPVAGPLVRPEPRVVPRGEPVRWLVAAPELDSLHLQVLAGDSAATDTVLLLRGADTVATAPLAPGHYRYVARPAGVRGPVLAEGPVTVERFSEEMLRPAVERPADTVAAGGAGRPAREPASRPLHTHPAPYLLAVVLLCAEWILRRRRGLR